MTALYYSGTIQDVKGSIPLELTVKLTENEPKASALVSPCTHAQHGDDLCCGTNPGKLTAYLFNHMYLCNC